MTETIKKITDAGFDKVVESSTTQPVLIDFWATWCGPCIAMASTLETLAQDLEGKLSIVKLNVDENPIAVAHQKIRSIPTIVLYKNKEVLATCIGLKSKEDLLTWLEEHGIK